MAAPSSSFARPWTSPEFDWASSVAAANTAAIIFERAPGGGRYIACSFPAESAAAPAAIVGPRDSIGPGSFPLLRGRRLLRRAPPRPLLLPERHRLLRSDETVALVDEGLDLPPVLHLAP